MEEFFLAIGSVVLLVAVVEIFWTTLWADGAAGPISNAATTLVWRGLRRLGGHRSRILGLSGPLAVATTIAAWVMLLVAGWALVFAGDENSLNPLQGSDVSWAGRIYFVTYTLFTMGNGDFSPVGGVWQITTALAVASGMVTITMAVSYVISVVRAVSSKRAFAATVDGLGQTAEDLVATGWNGSDLSHLDLPLHDLAARLAHLADQHLAFPILHYYHPRTSRDAVSVAVAIFDDALTLLETAVTPPYRNGPVLHQARASVDAYLATLTAAFIRKAPEAPPLPDVDRLRAGGIPTISQDEFTRRVAHLEARRRAALGAVRADAWEWPAASRDKQAARVA